jgi:carbon-monoxide dehydrogenase large subunit
VEDIRFLTGQGRYTADRSQSGDPVAGFLRSDFANGRILSIDTAAASEIGGVAAVLTIDDMPAVPVRIFSTMQT